MNRQPRVPAIFLLLWLFIIFVSVVDGYLLLRNRHIILAYELNPIARQLISWNAGSVWFLIAVKFAGTVIACAAVLLLYRAKPRVGIVIATTLAVLQFGLLMFLLFF